MESQELKEASASFREVLRIRRLGSADQLVDRHVVKTLEKLANLHKAKGDVEGALEASRQVLRIQEVSPEYQGSSRLRETGVTLRCIAELHQATGDLVAATESCARSVNQLEQAAAADQLNTFEHTAEQVANMEQFVSSLLLMGSIYHESCEPLQAHQVLHRAVMAIQHALASSPAYASLSSLGEVTKMLGVIHGAACA
jgi:tetratricopeptide (TPR) repeat protein